MDVRRLARSQALSRMAFGAGLLLTPGIFGRSWVGAAGARTGAKVLAAGLGARDLGIGVGTVRALGDPAADARPWVLAGLLGDSADLAGTLLARRDLPTLAVPAVAVLAGASVGLGAWVLRSLGEPPAPAGSAV